MHAGNGAMSLPIGSLAYRIGTTAMVMATGHAMCIPGPSHRKRGKFPPKKVAAQEHGKSEVCR